MSKFRFAPHANPLLKRCQLYLLLGCMALCLATLTGGQYDPSASRLLATLLGHGDPLTNLIILDLRLPRFLAALGIGAALAVSGSIFQRTAGNPLASPDLVGFTVGSASGALVTLLLLQLSGNAVILGALLGGVLSALLVTGIAHVAQARGERMIMVGIAIAALLAALNEYLLTRAELDDAQEARLWLFGSLDSLSWSKALMVLGGCALLLPIAAQLGQRLRLLELGNDLAEALGLPVAYSQYALLLVALALTALAIATAGPIGFIALAAPQLVKRLTHTSDIGIVAPALMGALLTAAADLLAQRLLAPFQIPVGLLTGALGGLYLIYLLASQWRRTL
ncbi:iron complex transport system permease protein [Pseudomonas duriflava]|uniref:Iron complex transport system permease protein n=1 Tax=Pseudomonas duriflava TaxID=459528 RepID=A0A562QMN5_9PSED|nr:iron chelate uptake ABC transporter family permease subunit [Pseudomonas duriflava]TWI57460.1 iron complex transport system permease protein [Pseudomonas duriflava]